MAGATLVQRRRFLVLSAVGRVFFAVQDLGSGPDVRCHLTDPAEPAKHILVVNDAEEMIELFRDILEGMGHRVSATTYAPEDLSEVARAAPDLVILDLLMGGESVGWQLAQKMRMSRATQDIPILLCTGATKEAREQEGWLVANGIKLVLKPFRIEDLELAVTKALALPELLVRTEEAGAEQP